MLNTLTQSVKACQSVPTSDERYTLADLTGGSRQSVLFFKVNIELSWSREWECFDSTND